MPIDFGLTLPFGPSRTNLDSFTEDLDKGLPLLGDRFKSLWMTDHFFWGDGDPTYEAWTVMTYLAARYPKHEIGPMVLGQSYRNPALLAKMAATLQTLCHGRYIMGIGAGWKEDEYRGYNYEYPPANVRLEQLEDTLEIMKRLWTQPGPVTYHGKHYKIEAAYCEPRPNPVPKIIVGGAGWKTMLLAARYADMWNLSDSPIARFKDRHAILRRHLDTVKRDPKSLRLTWFGRLGVAKTEAAAIKAGGGRWTKDNAFIGTPAQVVDQMQAFVAEGVDYFMIEILGFPNPDVIGMVLEEVLPKLKG